MYAIVFHAHQTLNKIAYAKMRRELSGGAWFPPLANILHFEGQRGPDSTKFKNAATVKQPWHFINPLNQSDTQLAQTVGRHYKNLVTALRAKDDVKASFEAAWLAHAVVDGLTPAHHYPYETALTEIRGDADYNNRTSTLKRITAPGENMYGTLVQSLRLVGPKGLLTTHTTFEAGAYILLKIRRSRRRLSKKSLRQAETLKKLGAQQFFLEEARRVAAWNLYDEFLRLGWTPRLARKVSHRLLPTMSSDVALIWLAAAEEAAE